VAGNAMEIVLMAEQLNKRRATNDEEDAASPIARLIIRAQSGDATAFDQIVTGHQHRVVALAWRMLGNQDDARDAAQEAFLRVFKHIKKFDPAQDFFGWLYRIVVNVCRDQARKRRSNVSSFEAEIESGAIAEPASPLNTETAAMVAQEQAIVLKALATLTEKERTAIVLRDLEGLPTDEVARILGSSPTTVRSQISSARAKIRAFRSRYIAARSNKQ
jgi:RNA polymerase sigma-70 factor (ECF subfamily)